MIDLEEQFNFTNKRSHPTNRKMIVYRHLIKQQAEYFAELMIDVNIDFEVQVDEEHEKKPTYFGVARIHEKQVDNLNYIALGKDRKKFIDSVALRWIIIGSSILVLFLGVVGAIVSN
jgi:hypothetical protein